MKKIVYLLIFVFFIISCAPIRIACIGDSITYGSGIKGRDSLGYPQQMQRMLGEKYSVQNFGVGGATMLKKGNKPYWNQPEYQNSLSFKPKVIILMLGTNDSKPINWNTYANEFEKDYIEMISTYQQLKPKPQIYLGLPPPVVKNKWGIQKNIVEGEMTTIIKRIAKVNKLELIDFKNLFKDKDEMIPDYIHPNADGAKLMAFKAYNLLK